MRQRCRSAGVSHPILIASATLTTAVVSLAAVAGSTRGTAAQASGAAIELTVGDFAAPGVLKTYRDDEVVFTSVRRGPSSLDLALRDAIHCVL